MESNQTIALLCLGDDNTAKRTNNRKINEHILVVISSPAFYVPLWYCSYLCLWILPHYTSFCGHFSWLHKVASGKTSHLNSVKHTAFKLTETPCQHCSGAATNKHFPYRKGFNLNTYRLFKTLWKTFQILLHYTFPLLSLKVPNLYP